MGKVFLNSENKLVVLTNNGKIEGNKTTTNISNEETFTIDAESVSSLLALINDIDLKIDGGLYRRGHFYSVISKDELSKEFVKTKNEYEEVKDSFYNMREKYDSLARKIKEYNSNKKIFWRPIDIEDL